MGRAATRSTFVPAAVSRQSVVSRRPWAARHGKCGGLPLTTISVGEVSSSTGAALGAGAAGACGAGFGAGVRSAAGAGGAGTCVLCVEVLCVETRVSGVREQGIVLGGPPCRLRWLWSRSGPLCVGVNHVSERGILRHAQRRPLDLVRVDLGLVFFLPGCQFVTAISGWKEGGGGKSEREHVGDKVAIIYASPAVPPASIMSCGGLFADMLLVDWCSATLAMELVSVRAARGRASYTLLVRRTLCSDV
jgi:hypothetical protein